MLFEGHLTIHQGTLIPSQGNIAIAPCSSLPQKRGS